MDRLTIAHVGEVFKVLATAGCRRAFGREKPTDEDELKELDMYVLILGEDVTPQMLAAGALVYLRNPSTARIWPTAADLRQQALAFRPEGAETVLDENSAYAAVRNYVSTRGASYWPGAYVLRAWRKAADRTLEDVVEDATAQGLSHLARWLPALETGRTCPHGAVMLGELAKVIPPEVVDAAAARSTWADLERTQGPVIAAAAQVAGAWDRWLRIDDDGEPAFRKAFRDTYTALLERARRDRYRSEAEAMLGCPGGLGDILALPMAARPSLRLADAGEPTELFGQGTKQRARAPVHATPHLVR